MEPNDLPIVVPPLDLSDDCAAILIDFLRDLTDVRERHYAGQLLRRQHSCSTSAPPSDLTEAALNTDPPFRLTLNPFAPAPRRAPRVGSNPRPAAKKERIHAAVNKWRDGVRFEKRNALRWQPRLPFDFIWCAGLFDYLSHRQSAFLIRSLWAMLAPEGRLVVGNFAKSHRTRPWIEWCGNWFLQHRSEEDMHALARAAAMDAAEYRIEIDRLEAIWFLVAVKRSSDCDRS